MHQPPQLGLQPHEFIWASGMEDTFVPQTRPGHRALDEYELMGHYQHWREDLALGRSLGLQAMRWGVPWYRVEPQPGQYDWSWTDQVLPYLVEELGITPIIDLMHYGCPFWLRGEFDNPNYPQAVAAYAAAFAQRYTGLVRWYTPLNEPLVNAMMCGRRGLWPPYLRGERGYLRVLLQLAWGIVNTVEVLRAIEPRAVMVHVEAASMTLAAREDLQPLAAEQELRKYLGYDLISGAVSPTHPLYTWLLRHGIPPDSLAQLAERRVALDLLGLNFYPQWATTQLYVGPGGSVAQRKLDRGGRLFGELLAGYHRRYGVPIMVTETSARGSDAVRSRWLARSLAAIRQLRAAGVPIVGYTWFPLCTMIDWAYRLGRRPLHAYRLELGLYRLDEHGPAGRWRPTPLVREFQQAIQQPEVAIGPWHAGCFIEQQPEWSGKLGAM